MSPRMVRPGFLLGICTRPVSLSSPTASARRSGALQERWRDRLRVTLVVFPCEAQGCLG